MGACVSLSLSRNSCGDVIGAPSAHVISLNGELLQFPAPVTVSELLLKQQLEPKSESSFLCNSDTLYFDHYISPLKPEYQLQAGQIYFMLPKTKLHYKLSASDMAALAVKASLALQKTSANSASATKSSTFSRRRKNSKSRISPIILDLQHQEEDYAQNAYSSQNKIGAFSSSDSSNHKTSGLGVSRSGSVRKFQRLSSKRAKLAVRSFRLKLSTIYEGSVLQSH